MEKALIFLKGILMGICDTIPGISGGTIAFITGIYERLINAINSISIGLGKSFFRMLAKRDKASWNAFKQKFLKLDPSFLITLGLGIATAILLGSRAIKYLLDNHFVYTISFFIGLILASSKIIHENIKEHKAVNYLFCAIGLIIGGLFAVLIPVDITPTLTHVFVGGFVAISAMFLPGISGAFILLIMGLYEYMIDALHSIAENLATVVVFLIGAAAGALTISKVIAFLFRKDRCKTLYFLLGLVIGAIAVPIKKIAAMTPVWSWEQALLMAAFILLGIGIVAAVRKLEKSKKKKTRG